MGGELGLLDTLVHARDWNRFDESVGKTGHDYDPERILCHAFAQKDIS